MLDLVRFFLNKDVQIAFIRGYVWLGIFLLLTVLFVFKKQFVLIFSETPAMESFG